MELQRSFSVCGNEKGILQQESTDYAQGASEQAAADPGKTWKSRTLNYDIPEIGRYVHPDAELEAYYTSLDG